MSNTQDKHPMVGQTLLKNARLATFSPLHVETADLRIRDGRIIERAPALADRPPEERLDLAGCLVIPGMVCAHTHLYSALARGMPGPSSAPQSFVDILEKIWWRLDRALDAESIRLSALVGAVDALKAGTTTLIDHHASPNAIYGSLELVGRALVRTGLRGVLCYEVTDRGGKERRDRGLDAHREILERTPDGRLSGLVGAHASFTLSDESLRLCSKLARDAGVGLHIHVAEDPADGEDCRERFGMSLVERLDSAGALGPKTIIAHATHLGEDELRRLDEAGCWVVHNPRSNMNNRVGFARVDAFGPRTALGTDGIGADMFEEARHAFFKARDAGAHRSAEDCAAMIGAAQELGGQLLGVRLGSLEPGAEADLAVLDYDPPTPLHSGNLAWHLIFGISSSTVRDVMVAGEWRLRRRVVLGIDMGRLLADSREAAQELWRRMEQLANAQGDRPT